MTTPRVQTPSLEEQIGLWRSYLSRRQAIHTVDVAELEDHLREQVASLVASGLAEDEAFLVAMKRMGGLDALSREFAREHSDRLWKQLVASPDGAAGTSSWLGNDGVVAFGLAVAAAVLFKVPSLFGLDLDKDEGFYLRHASFFVLPLLTGYFAWKRPPETKTLLRLALAFVAALVIVNMYPFAARGDTLGLAALHLPIALWLAVGVAYAGGKWHESARRMDFVRFSGELFIYYALIAAGGGVLAGVTAIIFQAAGIKPDHFLQYWLVPCGAVGAVLVASWLVEAKQSVIENMAPVLTRLFTPLFALLLVAFLITLLVTGRGVNMERDVLIGFDALLAVVVGLLLYSISARDAHAPPGVFDALQLVLVVSALVVDAVALWAIASRISTFGFTPNRVAALGENVVLLVNLVVSAVHYLRFIRGQGSFARLERWQTDYLPVYAAWAAVVVIVFPPLFGYA